MQSGETQVVVWTVDSDVFFAMFAEGRHECFEIGFATLFAQILGGEIRVHTGAIPVALERFAVVFHVDAIFFTKTVEDVASHPDFIGATL